jgi:SRSO17 transposase
VVAGCFFRRREVRVRARALADQELYLPRSWTGNPLRLAAAGIPAGTGFATKPELLQMIKRAAVAGMPSGWVAADEAYVGHRPALSPPA